MSNINLMLPLIADHPVFISVIGDEVVRHQQGTPYVDLGAIAIIGNCNH